MWNKKEMSQLDVTLTRVPLSLTFDLEFSRSNCISGMGGSIVLEQKGQESLGCPDVKQQPLCDPKAEDIVTDGVT